MAKTNKKEVKKIKVKIVYSNFVDKYTKKPIPVGTEISMTEDRVNKNLENEKAMGVKLIEILDNINDDNGEDDTDDAVNGADNTNDAE